VLIYDESSFEVYKLLESFSDGYGAWKVLDVLGKPLMDLDEALVHDLMTWRWIGNIVRRQNSKQGDNIE